MPCLAESAAASLKMTRLASSTAERSASPGAAGSERVVEITVSDGKAEVYRGEERVGTTPYTVRGRLGERVRLTLRRDGYSDEPVEFVVGEKKAFMYTLAKR